MYDWKSTNSTAFWKRRPRVSLLWIFNLKKSSKQWTEFIRFGVRSFFFIFSNLKNVDVVMLLLFHVLKITRLGKKIQCNIQNQQIQRYKFLKPVTSTIHSFDSQLQKTWQVMSNSTFCMIFLKQSFSSRMAAN